MQKLDLGEKRENVHEGVVVKKGRLCGQGKVYIAERERRKKMCEEGARFQKVSLLL